MAGGDRIQPQPPCCLTAIGMSLLAKPSLSLKITLLALLQMSKLRTRTAQKQQNQPVVQGLGSMARAFGSYLGRQTGLEPPL